jgi:hypothetical protein
MATVADKLGIAPGPGGWAKSLVGAAQSALTGLGDVDTSPVTPGGSGALEGISGTIRNRDARIRQTQLDQQKKAMQDAAESRENRAADDQHQKFADAQKKQQETDAQIAHENASMIHEQGLLHQLDPSYIDESIADGKTVFNNLTTGENPAPKIAEGMTSSQIQTMLAQGKISGHNIHVYPTGSVETGLDPNGKPIMRTTYSITGDVPSKTVDAGTAAYINKFIPDQKIQEGQVLSGAHFGTLTGQAAAVSTATKARDQALIDAGVMDKKQTDQLENVNLGPDWNNALAAAKNNPRDALAALQAQDAARVKSGQPAKYPNLADDVMAKYGGPDKFQEVVQKQQDLNERMVHDRADEQDRRDAAQAKKDSEHSFLGDPKLIGNPAAYRNSLDPEARQLVDAIGTGHMVLNRLDYLAAKKPEVLEAVTAAYPDFDSSKANGYSAVVKNFTSGPTSVLLRSGGTALKHLQRLMDATNTASTINPLSNSYTDRQVLLNNAATELARYNAGGGSAPSKDEIEHAREALSPINPLKRGEAIKEQTRALSDAMGALRHQWDDAAPSEAYRRPMPSIDPGAIKAVDAIIPGENNLDPNQQKPTPPVGKPGPAASDGLPTPPAGHISVQIPGLQPGFIPAANLAQFKKDHPNAVVGD